MARSTLAPLILFVLTAGCAHGERAIVMNPLRFTATKGPGGEPTVDVIEPSWLFENATRDYRQGNLDRAARRFTLILKEFPHSKFAGPARYDRGLCYLRLDRPADAARDFRAYLATAPSPQDRADTLLKLGEALTKAGSWKEASQVLMERLSSSPLDLMTEVEVRAYLVRAYRKLGQLSQARRQADKALRLYSRHLTDPAMRGNYFVGMASFEAAACLHDLFRHIKFVLPVERMEKDLLDKATLFLKAQSEYLRTIRVQNTYFATRAGIRLGRLYEDFYRDIMEAEVPAELTEEERAIYFQELRRQARPLLLKAIDAYERNMKLAMMHGAKEEWFVEVKERLRRLRAILRRQKATWQ